jgi:biotin carboxyl carrier protein
MGASRAKITGRQRGKDMKYYTKVNDKEYIIEIGHDNELLVNDEKYAIDFKILPISGLASLLINNQSLEAVVESREEHWEVLTKGELYNVFVQDERAYRLAQARGVGFDATGEVLVKAPMPGVVIKVLVAEGEAVEKNQQVVILESMKMENELRSPRDGVVTAVKIQPGAGVEKEQVLVIIGDPET